MTRLKGHFEKAALAVLAAVLLSGCETVQQGASQLYEDASTEVSEWEMPWGEDDDDGESDNTKFSLVPDNLTPLFNSVVEEYCVAPQVVNAYGSQELGAITTVMVSLYVQGLTAEERKKSLYCDQNLGGIVLVTDRVMNEALTEVGMGVQIAGEALELNVASQQATLARIARMKNLSLGEKLDPAYLQDMEELDGEIEVLADATEAKLAELSKSGGVSAAAEAKLLQAHQHFVNFRHAQGKALSGFALFEAARKQYGSQIIAQAFDEAIRIDQAQFHKTSDDQKFAATEELTRAFLGAVPKFGETMFSGGRISSAIHEASDTEDYQDAIERISNQEPDNSQELNEYAGDVEVSAAGLGLPTATSLGT